MLGLDKVKLFNKDQLLDALKQRGHGNIAAMLNDKCISGQELLELKKSEISDWKLTTTQKKKLFEFINMLKKEPSMLLETLPTTPILLESPQSTQKPLTKMNQCNAETTSGEETSIELIEVNYLEELRGLLGKRAMSNQSNSKSKFEQIEEGKSAPSDLTTPPKLPTTSHRPATEGIPAVPSAHKIEDKKVISPNTPGKKLPSSIPNLKTRPSRQDVVKKESPGFVRDEKPFSNVYDLKLPPNFLKTSPSPVRKPPPLPAKELAKSWGDLSSSTNNEFRQMLASEMKSGAATNEIHRPRYLELNAFKPNGTHPKEARDLSSNRNQFEDMEDTKIGMKRNNPSPITIHSKGNDKTSLEFGSNAHNDHIYYSLDRPQKNPKIFQEKSEKSHNDFSINFLEQLSRTVKEKSTQKETDQFVIADIIPCCVTVTTPPSSDDEGQEKFNFKKKLNNVQRKSIPLPPARMVTPEMWDDSEDETTIIQLSGDPFYQNIKELKLGNC
ncbi:hypothetical protein JTB14_030800 [Gonioctena quinquepunctata]|nr:hypothetical protein JTB14_030800 [Gonioctena quinquepunctata]